MENNWADKFAPFQAGDQNPAFALANLFAQAQQQPPQDPNQQYQAGDQNPAFSLAQLFGGAAPQPAQQQAPAPMPQGNVPQATPQDAPQTPVPAPVGMADPIAPTQGAISNPWSALSETISNMPRIQEMKNRDLAAQQKIKSDADLAKQQNAMKIASDRLPILTQMLQANPQNAQNPQMVKAITDTYKSLGIPAPIQADGSIDMNALKPSYSSIDLKTQQYIDTLEPAQRKVLLDRYSNVPADAYTNTAYISAKDQATMERAKQLGVKNELYNKSIEQRGRLQTERNRLSALSLSERTDMDNRRIAQIDALVNQANAGAQRSLAEAAAIPQRIQMSQQELTGKLDYWKGIVAKGRGGANAAMNQALSTVRTINGQYSRYQSQYDGLLNSLSNAQANGADESVISDLQDQMANIKTSMGGLETARGQAQEFINSAAGSLTAGAELQGVSGKPVTVQPGKQPAAKSVVGSDGHTYEQLANGKWKVVK